MLNFKTNHKHAALKELICHADAILIGAGAGLSASAGLTYSGERFEQNFADFRQKYGISDMYSGGFYPYDTLEEYWAWWSRQIYINRYDITPGRPYRERCRSGGQRRSIRPGCRSTGRSCSPGWRRRSPLPWRSRRCRSRHRRRYTSGCHRG